MVFGCLVVVRVDIFFYAFEFLVAYRWFEYV